jgi:hypothetical protein
MGESTRINMYKNLLVKLEGKGSLGRPRKRWEDSTKNTSLRNRTGECRLDSPASCEHGNVSSVSKMNSGNVLNRWDTVSFSSRAVLHAVRYSWWGIKLFSYYITINSGTCHNVKIGPGANPSSYPMGPRDFSPESKGLGAKLATHLYPVKS